MLFFVLSGFLMAHLHVACEFNAANLFTYAARRIARVYPLFLLVAGCFMLQGWLAHGGGVAAGLLVPWLRQILLIDPGFSVLWTVRVELLFYAAFVGIWWLFHVTGRRCVLAILLGAVLVLSTGSLAYSGMFFASARFFLFGVISALLWKGPVPRARGADMALSTLAVLAFACVPLSFPQVIKMVFGADTQPWHNDEVAAWVVLLFNLVLRDRSWLGRLLAAPAARWLGLVSYSLYLWQPFVLQGVAAFLPSAGTLLSFALISVGVLIVAGTQQSVDRAAGAGMAAGRGGLCRADAAFGAHLGRRTRQPRVKRALGCAGPGRRGGARYSRTVSRDRDGARLAAYCRQRSHGLYGRGGWRDRRACQRLRISVNPHIPFHHRFARRRLRQCLGQPIPQSCFGAGAPDGFRQRTRLAHRELQREYIVPVALGHAADIGANDRPAEHPGLGNHQAEAFPPDRRHDAPIDARHAAGELRHFVGAVIGHDAVSHRTIGFRFQESEYFIAHRGRGVAQIVAVQLHDKIRKAFRPQQGHGAQDDLHAFHIDILAEEAEPVAALACRRQVAAGGVIALPIGDMGQALRLDTPGGVLIEHEPAGAGERVHLRKMAHEPHLAHQELFRRTFGDTLVAAHLARMIAQRAIGAAHHVAVGGTDAHELMEREHQPARGQRVADQCQDIDAERQEMMHVHDIRRDFPAGTRAALP